MIAALLTARPAVSPRKAEQGFSAAVLGIAVLKHFRSPGPAAVSDARRLRATGSGARRSGGLPRWRRAAHDRRGPACARAAGRREAGSGSGPATRSIPALRVGELVPAQRRERVAGGQGRLPHASPLLSSGASQAYG